MIIAVDFDGTCVDHQYPDIGADVPGAVDWLRRLEDAGARLILWTMRSGETLTAALRWFQDRGIGLWGVNRNPEQDWSTSPKCYAHRYVDDAAAGVPLRSLARVGARPAVDWEAIGPALLIETTDRVAAARRPRKDAGAN